MFTKLTATLALTGVVVLAGGQAASAATASATERAQAPTAAASQEFQPAGWWEAARKRAVIWALRNHSDWLADRVRVISPTAANYLRQYGPVLADYLEDGDRWAKNKISTYLQSQGVPKTYADIIATVIIDYVFS
jgi:hypothetical protein